MKRAILIQICLATACKLVASEEAWHLTAFHVYEKRQPLTIHILRRDNVTIRAAVMAPLWGSHGQSMTSMHWGDGNTKGLKFTPAGLSGIIQVTPKSEGGKASQAVSLKLTVNRSGNHLQGTVDARQGLRPLSGRITPPGQEATAAFIQLQTPFKGKNNDPLADFMRQAAIDGFDGVELGLSIDKHEQHELIDLAAVLDLSLIGEVATGDWWVAQSHRSEQDHLDDLKRALDACAACDALQLNAMTGYDAWPLSKSVDYFHRCLEAAGERKVKLCIETHRSRTLSTPWATQAILEQLPGLQLTCDFSHWVVVCERLLDGCEDAVAAATKHCHHIHARVGHAQGPQVADPADPSYATELAAHLDWWKQCWSSMASRGLSHITMNPEFGVDRYLPLLPYTQQPVAHLPTIHKWMADMLRYEYGEWASQEGFML